jgi:hypothetical protein
LQDTGRTGFLAKLSRTTNKASVSNAQGVVTTRMQHHKSLSMPVRRDWLKHEIGLSR